MDIIERAARAIFACNFHHEEDQQIIDRKWIEWIDSREKSYRQARTVLSALREPDEGMIEAGWVAFDDVDEVPSMRTVWQAMIGKALKG